MTSVTVMENEPTWLVHRKNTNFAMDVGSGWDILKLAEKRVLRFLTTPVQQARPFAPGISVPPPG